MLKQFVDVIINVSKHVKTWFVLIDVKNMLAVC